MVGSGRKKSLFEELQETHVQIIVKQKKNTFLQDAFETFTGVSGSAITVGGKVTAETVIYAGESNPSQEMAGFVFTMMSIAANGIDFLRVPVGYLYNLFSRQPVPFNKSNNLKWALATLSLALGIISFTILVTSRIISFASAAMALVGAGISFGKFFYDKRQIEKKIDANQERIDQLCEAIRQDMLLTNELHRQKHLIENPDDMVGAINEVEERFEKNREELKQAYADQTKFEIALSAKKSALTLTYNALRVVFAVAVLVGTILILNPATLPIGMPILATAAIASLAVLIGKKIIEFAQRRADQRKGLLDDKVIDVTVDSTSCVARTLGFSPVHDMSEPAARQTDDETKPLLEDHDGHTSAEELRTDHDSAQVASMAPSI